MKPLFGRLWRVAFAALLMGLVNQVGAQAAGDTCATAGEITADGSYNFDTTGASADDPCYPGGLTVWYKYTATVDGPINADLCGSSFDSYLTVYEGPDCPLVCNDLIDADGGCGDDASLSFNGVAGTTYYFAINGNNVSDFGAGVFTITGPGLVEAGDTCAEAGVITQNGSYEFDTTGASGDDPCYAPGRAVWFQFTAPVDGVVNADLCGTSYRSYMRVFAGPECPVSCANVVSEGFEGCDDDPILQFPVTAGTTYYFSLDGLVAGDFGPGVFNFDFTFPGNTCAEAVDITLDGSYDFDTTSASADEPCFEGGRTVWFRYTAPQNDTMRVQADTCGSALDTYLAVFQGPDCPVICPDEGYLAETDNDCGGLQFVASPGETYYFAVNGSSADDFGPGQLNITTTPILAGDTCADAGMILGSGTYTFDTTGASIEDPCLADSPAVWYRYDAIDPGKMVLDTGGSSFDTYLKVFAAEDCTLTCDDLVAENDENDVFFDNNESRVVLPLAAGQSYFIVVDGYNANHFGPGVLNVEFLPVEPGDLCTTPVIIDGQGTFAFDTTNAPTEFLCSGLESSEPSPTIWYEFTAPSNGTAQADTCGTSWDTYLTVFEGPDCPETCGTPLAEDDDACNRQSIVQFPVTAGTTYRIVLSGYEEEDFGTGTLNFTFTPAAGDTCDTAGIIIGNGLYPYDTTGASGDDPCPGPQYPAVWFRFVAPDDGAVVADLEETTGNSGLRVFEGAGCPVSCTGIVIEGIPDFLPGGNIVFETNFGETFHIGCEFASPNETGSGILNFRFIPVGGDFTNDGIVNVADVTEFARLVDAGVQLPVSVGDFNNDAVVDQLDVEELADDIVNLNGPI